MRVRDEVLSCVAYLYGTFKGDQRPVGTAWFAAHQPSTDPEQPSPVLTVSARHVIEGIARESDDGVIRIAVNDAVASTRRTFDTDANDWAFHPSDTAADVAVFRGPTNLAGTSSLAYEIGGAGLVTRATMAEENIGIGDEVFISGLFVSHVGRLRNEPIVRVGNIASIPAERVTTRLGDADVFLVEMRSLGGLSGSPAFVHEPLRKFNILDHVKFSAFREEPGFALLGMVQGHFEMPPLMLDPERVNMGIAIITPAVKIVEAIEALAGT